MARLAMPIADEILLISIVIPLGKVDENETSRGETKSQHRSTIKGVMACLQIGSAMRK